MKRRLMAFLMALLMCLTLLPMSAWAGAPEANKNVKVFVTLPKDANGKIVSGTATAKFTWKGDTAPDDADINVLLQRLGALDVNEWKEVLYGTIVPGDYPYGAPDGVKWGTDENGNNVYTIRFPFLSNDTTGELAAKLNEVLNKDNAAAAAQDALEAARGDKSSADSAASDALQALKMAQDNVGNDAANAAAEALAAAQKGYDESKGTAQETSAQETLTQAQTSLNSALSGLSISDDYKAALVDAATDKGHKDAAVTAAAAALAAAQQNKENADAAAETAMNTLTGAGTSLESNGLTFDGAKAVSDAKTALKNAGSITDEQKQELVKDCAAKNTASDDDTPGYALEEALRQGDKIKVSVWENNYDSGSTTKSKDIDIVVDEGIDGKTYTEEVAGDTEHSVTVNYVMGIDVHQLYQIAPPSVPSVTERHSVGELYDIPTPEIEGLVADKPGVTGTMGDADVTETVTYSVKKYSVTVHYTLPDGALKPDGFVEKKELTNLENGYKYTVYSPEYMGLEANWTKVQGTIEGNDIDVTVAYRLPTYAIVENWYTLKVVYTAPKNYSAPATIVTKMKEGSAYSIPTPTIKDLTPSLAAVSGTLNADTTVTVKYTKNWGKPKKDCPHTGGYVYYDNGNGTHKVVCATCKGLLVEAESCRLYLSDKAVWDRNTGADAKGFPTGQHYYTCGRCAGKSYEDCTMPGSFYRDKYHHYKDCPVCRHQYMQEHYNKTDYGVYKNDEAHELFCEACLYQTAVPHVIDGWKWFDEDIHVGWCSVCSHKIESVSDWHHWGSRRFRYWDVGTSGMFWYIYWTDTCKQCGAKADGYSKIPILHYFFKAGQLRDLLDKLVNERVMPEKYQKALERFSNDENGYDMMWSLSFRLGLDDYKSAGLPDYETAWAVLSVDAYGVLSGGEYEKYQFADLSGIDGKKNASLQSDGESSLRLMTGAEDAEVPERIAALFSDPDTGVAAATPITSASSDYVFILDGTNSALTEGEHTLQISLFTEDGEPIGMIPIEFTVTGHDEETGWAYTNGSYASPAGVGVVRTADGTAVTIAPGWTEIACDGAAHVPALTLKTDEETPVTLTGGTDFDVAYYRAIGGVTERVIHAPEDTTTTEFGEPDGVEAVNAADVKAAGDYYAVVTGKGNYSGTSTVRFTLATALEPYLRASVEGDNLTYSVKNAPANAVLIAARYEKNGGMTYTKTVTLAAGDAQDVITMQGTGTKFRLMLVDKTTYAPLCHALSN